MLLKTLYIDKNIVVYMTNSYKKTQTKTLQFASLSLQAKQGLTLLKDESWPNKFLNIGKETKEPTFSQGWSLRCIPINGIVPHALSDSIVTLDLHFISGSDLQQ